MILYVTSLRIVVLVLWYFCNMLFFPVSLRVFEILLRITAWGFFYVLSAIVLAMITLLYNMLTTARVEANMGTFSEAWFLKVRVALTKIWAGDSLRTNWALRQEDGSCKNFRVQNLPWYLFFIVKVLAKALYINTSISHVHLNLLLSAINEIMITSSFTLELVGICKIEDLWTKLTYTEGLVLYLSHQLIHENLFEHFRILEQ